MVHQSHDPLGYSAFEFFGWILDKGENERTGEYKALLDKYGLAQHSAYRATDIASHDDEASEIEFAPQDRAEDNWIYD